MNYLDTLEAFSQSGIGALVLSADGRILSVNESGARLLHGDEDLIGRRLTEVAPILCEKYDKPVYANVSFGEYLLRIPTPEVDDLPDGAQIIVFRDATNDACHDMLTGILNQLSEAVILCDADSRIFFLNDASVRMDSVVLQDVRGMTVEEAYVMHEGSEMIIPKVIQERKPVRNHRQEYMTCYGKQISNISNAFPVVQNGQVLGAFNVFVDWNETDNLHRQILSLQEKILRMEETDNVKRKSALAARYTFDDIIYKSSAMAGIIEQCRQAARFDSSVMFYGETGTGKELFAQSIHNASRRANGPFLAINCAALPENLLEAMMFGTEKGAFTNAESRAGLFEQANHGTLLLDELNSMDIHLQAKLLRVLQEGTLRRVGGSKEIRVDVRVLSNLNVPPHIAIAEGKLRKDLFYRLGVVNIDIPPLRERKEDLPLLVKHFIMEYNQRISRNVTDVDQKTMEKFQAYRWPGNVRELQHAVEHAMNILPDDQSVLLPQHFPKHISAYLSQDDRAEQAAENQSVPVIRPSRILGAPGNAPRFVQAAARNESLDDRIQNMEKDSICKALYQNGGNITKAAQALGLTRQTLQYRMKRYRIDVQKLMEKK